MEIRRRAVETVRAQDADSLSDKEPKNNAVKHALVEEGHRLYAEAERSGFQNTAKLTCSLHSFLRAAMLGADEATDWISSFLDSMSALPPSAALHPSLLRLLQWIQCATVEEKEVYLVAEGMFHTMAHGGSTISKGEFDGAIQSLLSSQHEHSPQLTKSANELRVSVKKMLSSALESNNSAEVTVDMFCESAMIYARGELPHVGGELTPQQQRDFKEANILKKVTKFPVQTAHFYRRSLLKMIERRGVKWVWASFPTKQFYLLLLAYILPMISAQFILSSIATVVFVGAFITMSVGTLQMMLAAEKVFSFMEYSSIFQYFSEGNRKIDTRKPEMLLIKRSILPCVTFGIAYCVTLLTFHLSHQSVISNEVMCVLSAFFTLAVFFQFECYKSPLFIVSSLSRLLSWLYVFLIVFRPILSIPEFLLYFGSAAVPIPVIPGFTLRINLLTLFQFPFQCVLITYFLVHNKWHNFYSGLGPYLLFTSWWVLSRHFFALSSPLYLFLGTFGVVLVLALSPFLPILFLGSPLCILLYYGLSRQFFMCLGIVVAFVLVFLLVGRFSRRLMETKWLNISFDYVVLLQVLLSIPAVLIGASWFAHFYSPTDVPVVSLAQYSEYCGPQNWVGNNMVPTQLNCMHLRDRILAATGIVESIKIEQVSNDHELSLKPLPGPIRAALTCLLGQIKPMCGQRSDMETCERQFVGCNFHHHHKYTFAIGITVDFPPTDGRRTPVEKVSVTLLASNIFKEAVKNLQVGNHLHFNATFVSGMGSDRLVLQLVTLEGHIVRTDEESIQDSVQLFATQVIQSVTNTLAILFDVLLGYTAP